MDVILVGNNLSHIILEVCLHKSLFSEKYFKGGRGVEELVAVFAWSNYHEIKTNILIKTKILSKLMNLSKKKFK